MIERKQEGKPPPIREVETVYGLKKGGQHGKNKIHKRGRCSH